MTSVWPRGSEWRKWDLHLHAPGTKLNDQFGGDACEVWSSYCQALHESDVRAFGITDYFSADSFFNTVKEYRARYPDSEKVLFPNIELRTNDVVNRAQEEVNIHLLFNPFRPDFEEKISSFLRHLKTNKTDGNGRHVAAAELKQTSDFASATTLRHFIHEALEQTYGKTAVLLDNVLIVTAANNDGIRPERGKLRKLLITDELDKFSDAFFGNSKNVDYFLRNNRGEDKDDPTKPKPVLSGSDAHSLSDLKLRLGQVVSLPEHGTLYEPTWIKADLTFEGLKQIIFEPQNRVFIGDEPEVLTRVQERKTRYLESLHVTSVDGYREEQHGAWFNDERIPLGKELVAIIGNKGSGKSAVTDIIGLLGNSHNQSSRSPTGQKSEELFSFLNRDKFLKGGIAKHFQGALHWYEGEPDRKSLDAQVASHLPEKVEYLPQRYLERICANIADDEFRATLNEVIFRYVKKQDQHGQPSLDDLIRYLSQQADDDIAQKRQDLRKANTSVASVERKLTDDYRKEVEERIRLKRQEIQAHTTTRPDEKPNPSATELGGAVETGRIEEISVEIAALGAQIESLEAEQIGLSQSAEQLRQVKQAIERAAENLLSLEMRHKPVLAAAGLSFSEIVNLRLDYSSLDASVSQTALRLKQIEALLLDAEGIEHGVPRSRIAPGEKGQESPGTSVRARRSALESEKRDLVERLGKPAREYQEYLTALALWTDRDRELRGDGQATDPDTLNGLERELHKIASEYPQEVAAARAERTRIANEIFLKRRGLTQFYETVKQSIDAEIGKCRQYLGDYDISIEAGLRFTPSFFDEFLKFINLAAVGSFRGQEEGRAMLRNFTDAITDWQDENQVVSLVNAIANALHFDQRKEVLPSNAARDVFKQMKGQRSPQELYDYLYGFEYLEPKYDLKVDGKDLSELSPGERGGLLLIFYLMLDRQDIPLVIDQPEDNLDNRSVYEILVTFIKQARRRRQIILVTHNPNLAVVADAEQIVLVSIDKKNGKHDFDFYSGSIEDPRINQALVDILEGTLPAFDNRRLKYRKQPRRAS